MTTVQSPTPSVGRRVPDQPRPDVLGPSIRTASLVAGIGLLAMAILTPYARFVVLDGLVTPGDAAATVQDIAGFEGLFRSAVASLAVVAVLDIVVAAALFRLFAPDDRVTSMFAAWLRVAYGWAWGDGTASRRTWTWP